jgi:hypothetical protein
VPDPCRGARSMEETGAYESGPSECNDDVLTSSET